MIRSAFRSIRRTLSFRSKSKYRGSKKKAGANQNWENDSVHLKQEGGCSFAVKYLGCLEVSESRGTNVCSQAAHQMKMSSTGKKKQRVTLWITEDTLRVIDDETKSLVVDQVIEKVSFCTPDPHDEKLFSYICRDGTSRRWLCHSFKGIKETGERISHSVGCAFAACLAKKQQQNEQNKNFQRGTSTRKTLEARPNGVVLPQQSVETLQKLNKEEYNDRVQQVNQSFSDNPVPQQQTVEATVAASPVSKQAPDNNFARPRPSASGLDSVALTRHQSLPYRTKKAQGGTSTYQALTEDPLPPRIPFDPVTTQNNDLWSIDTNQQMTFNQTQQQQNPFKPQPIIIQQQAGFTSTVMQPQDPAANPFGNHYITTPTSPNPFNEKFV